MEILGIAGVAAITVIAYLIGEIIKATGLDNKSRDLRRRRRRAGRGRHAHHAGVPRDGLHNRRRGGYRIRPRGDGRESDRKAA